MSKLFRSLTLASILGAALLGGVQRWQGSAVLAGHAVPHSHVADGGSGQWPPPPL